MLTGLVDYAGLFPPASLSLDEAIRNFARYRQESDNWMLSRFICPVSLLPTLSEYDNLFSEAPPFRFSVLGTGGLDAPSFLRTFETNLGQIEAFRNRHTGTVEVDMMEVRLPSHLLEYGAGRITAFLEAVCALHARTSIPSMDIFFEVPLDHPSLPLVFESVANCPQCNATEFGVKFRCGGVEAAAFPSSEHLAHAIAASRDANVRFKATAGLHHPIRLFHPSVQTKMFGFLNVFGAAVLAATEALDAVTIRKILVDEEPANFHFDADHFAWNDRAATLHQIRQARSNFGNSFGSCSFDEPRDDLLALGLL